MSEDQKRKNSKNSVGPLDHFLGVGETNPEMSRDGSKTSSARKSKRVVHLLLDNGVRWPHIAVIAFNLVIFIVLNSQVYKVFMLCKNTLNIHLILFSRLCRYLCSY